MVFRNQEQVARIRARPLDRRSDGLNAQRLERGVQIIEATWNQIRVDRRDLETAIAQVHRGVKRRRMVLLVPAKPLLDLRTLRQNTALEFLQESGMCGGEMGDHLSNKGRWSL